MDKSSSVEDKPATAAGATAAGATAAGATDIERKMISILHPRFSMKGKRCFSIVNKNQDTSGSPEAKIMRVADDSGEKSLLDKKRMAAGLEIKSPDQKLVAAGHQGIKSPDQKRVDEAVRSPNRISVADVQKDMNSPDQKQMVAFQKEMNSPQSEVIAKNSNAPSNSVPSGPTIKSKLTSVLKKDVTNKMQQSAQGKSKAQDAHIKKVKSNPIPIQSPSNTPPKSNLIPIQPKTNTPLKSKLVPIQPKTNTPLKPSPNMRIIPSSRPTCATPGVLQLQQFYSFWSKVACSFEKFKDDDVLCDAVLTSESGREYRVHSVLLAAVSPVFESAFRANFNPGLYRVTLPEVEDRVLEVLLHFAYSGVLLMPTECKDPPTFANFLAQLKELGLDISKHNGCEIKFKCPKVGVMDVRKKMKSKQDRPSVLKPINRMAQMRSPRDDTKFQTPKCNPTSLKSTNNVPRCSPAGMQPANSTAKVPVPRCNPNGTESAKDRVDSRASQSNPIENRFPKLGKFNSGFERDKPTTTKPVMTDDVEELEMEASEEQSSEEYPSIDSQFEEVVEIAEVVEIIEDIKSHSSPPKNNKGPNKGNAGVKIEPSEAPLENRKKVGGTKKLLTPCDKNQKLKPCAPNKSFRSVSNDKLLKSPAVSSPEVKHVCVKPFICQICFKSFTEKENMISHTRAHMGEKPFVCSVCNKAFTRKGSLINHTRSHTGEKPYLCHYCGKAFSQQAVLIDHLSLHTGETRKLCPLCGEAVRTAKVLLFHLRAHKTGSLKTRRGCFKLDEQNTEITSVDGVVRYTCKICGKICSTKPGIMLHSTIHLRREDGTLIKTEEKPHVCPFCSVCFKTGALMQAHARTHTGERPFICNRCGRKFTQVAHLRRHIRSHDGIKPYACGTCGKMYANKTDVNIHTRRVHSEEVFVPRARRKVKNAKDVVLFNA